MKNIAAAIMVAATMSVASATSIDTFWLEDRPDAFALTMIGTGLSAFGTFVSPSGQWSLQGGYSGRYFPDGEYIMFNHGGQMSWVADPQAIFLETHGYVEGRNSPPETPLLVSERWADTVAVQNGWHGANPFIITSMPDFTDPSTWTWIGHWVGSGPAAVSVPEGGAGLALCFLLLLPYIRHRWGA